MAELRELQRKLDSIKGLREIVAAMRNLAAIYVRRAEATLDAIRPYSEVVETAVELVLGRAGVTAIEPDPDGVAVAIVFASDQGLCGAYNERIVRAAMEFTANAAGRVDVIAIGNRGASLLKMRGVEPIMTVSSPTSLEGIKAQVSGLAADVYDTYSEQGAGAMFFIYNTYEGAGRFVESVRPVLPPRRDQLTRAGGRRFRCDPILTASPEALLGDLAEEYLFVQLYRALLESHASENGARLLSMTAAASNIDDRLVDLTQQYQSVRQDAITSELLDVVGGAEALARDA